jgi:superfamily I DNA/RNA helicase
VARAPEDIQAAAASSAQLSVENVNDGDDDDCDVHTAPCESLTSVAGNAWSKQKVRQERGSSAIVVQGVYDGRAEASLVASRIESVLKAAAETAAAFQQASTMSTVKAAPAVSVAILVRSAWQFQEFEEQLLLRGVPYKLEGGTSFFAKADLRFPLALMRTLVSIL